MQQHTASVALNRKEPGSSGTITLIHCFAAEFWSEALIILVATLLWIPRLSGPIDLRWDSSVYYILGTSLTNGHGYRIESEPGAPAALQYPPLLPTIISLHQRAIGTTDPTVVAPWLRITYAILFLLYAVAVLRLAKRYLRPVFATTATLLCLLNPFTIFLSDLLFAEVPFALISVLFALVAAAGYSPARHWWHQISSFVLAASGFLLRSAGIVLLVAWVLDAMIRRRWRLFYLRAFISLVPVLGWQTYVSHVRLSREYSHPAYEYQRAPYQQHNVSYLENMWLIDPFKPELGAVTVRALLSRLGTSLGTVPSAMGEIVSAKEKDWRGSVLWVEGLVFTHRLLPVRLVRAPIFALSALVFAGIFVFIRRGEWIMTFVIVGSFALVCLTPWPGQFTRYLEPLAPFLTIAVMLGLVEITGILSRRRIPHGALVMQRFAVFLLLLAIFVEVHTAAWLFGQRAEQRIAFAGNKTETATKWFLYDRSWQAWQESINWINTHAPPTAIVATSSPHFSYLQTGRLAVFPPMEADPVEERRLLDSVPASYAIVDQLEFSDMTRRYLQPALELDPGPWRIVQKVGGASVYERRQTNAPSPF